MAESFAQGIIRAEKLAIFTAKEDVDEWQFRNFICEKWETLSQNMEGQSILFICGVHGNADGTLGDTTDSLETMKRQINEIGATESLREDMKKRNIKANFLGIHHYYENEETMTIDKNMLINKIKLISPDMVIMVICYSQILELRFLLEESGIFSELRVKRDLCVLSKGKILTLSDTQKDFLQIMAKRENITKDVQIQGQVGSGKTLLGIEVVKVKVAHYHRYYGKRPGKGKNQLRVILCYGTNLPQLLGKHFQSELSEDLSKLASIDIHFWDHRMKSFFKGTIEGHENYWDFKHTIVLIDEAYDETVI